MSNKEQLTNICFVANFHKTVFFNEIGAKISDRANIFWIVTKIEQFHFLTKLYGAEKVLYINRTFVNKESPIVDDFKLNELVYGDRVFKHEFDNGLKYLSNIQQPLYKFLLSNKIRFVFGELAWSHEVLIQRIAKQRPELNCVYLQFNVIRMPAKRFAFFRGETECDMVKFNEPVITDTIIKVEKPAYLKLNDKILSDSKSVMGRLSRVKRFLSGENIEKNDPNVIVNSLTRFKVAATEEINRSMYSLLTKTHWEEIENEKFIFYGFQKQPESSLDVSGRYYEDQHAIVVNLWRLLPSGWKIVVKEHTNAVGDRAYEFYKSLLKYPNIVLAYERIDSKLLIDKSQLVVTVNGTIGYEAALMKKPAITFAPVFFNKINYCKFIPFDDLVKYESLLTLISELNSQDDNRLEFSNQLMKSTFEGNVSDYVTDKTVMDEANLQKLCYAFLKVLNEYGKFDDHVTVANPKQ